MNDIVCDIARDSFHALLLHRWSVKFKILSSLIGSPGIRFSLQPFISKRRTLPPSRHPSHRLSLLNVNDPHVKE